QIAAPALPVYGHRVAQTPHLAALARDGVVFESAYCNSPLCAPSRAALLTGCLPSQIGAYDNAAEFRSDVPTFAHYLRALGYRTTLAGKMHFMGPDQLHGFEERLTTDIYPADFGWTPDWERPDERLSWYHNLLSVVQAGPCVTSNQIDFDEEVAFHANRHLYDWVRSGDGRPFFLVASFTHPHDPYAIPRAYWDRYDHAAIDAPAVPALPFEQLDAHSQRVHRMCALDEYAVTPEHVRRARHAYYGALSYVDDKLGQLLQTLAAIGQRENTIVIFLSDHGDQLGERGLWYKMTFFEWSMRVPLLVHYPRQFAARRVAAPASLVDLLPTLVELAGGDPASLAAPVAGRSLVPALRGAAEDQATAYGEYLGEGAAGPVLMIRRDRHKYIVGAPDVEMLFDLAADPLELHNLAGEPAAAALTAAFRSEAEAKWDPPALRAAVIASQRRRRLVDQALRAGRLAAWDFQPGQDASQQYMRNHLDLNDLERRARYPAPPAVEPRPQP
ncbi:MAG: choline-sulfatase, partial [Anaerolineales bacterium]|nr:choline-sulfatase [Anaerolineales bacterium]